MIEATLIKQNLSQRLQEDKKFRQLFLRSWTRNKIASQMRRLRKLRKFKQVDFKKKFHQSAISRIEQANYSSWTYKTLLRVTEALDGVLDINIRPIEEFTTQLAAEEKAEEAQFRKEAARAMPAAHVLVAETGQFIVRGGASEGKFSLEEAAKDQPKPEPSNISKVVKAPDQREPGLIAANQELAKVA